MDEPRKDPLINVGGDPWTLKRIFRAFRAFLWWSWHVRPKVVVRNQQELRMAWNMACWRERIKDYKPLPYDPLTFPPAQPTMLLTDKPEEPHS